MPQPQKLPDHTSAALLVFVQKRQSIVIRRITVAFVTGMNSQSQRDTVAVVETHDRQADNAKESLFRAIIGMFVPEEIAEKAAA